MPSTTTMTVDDLTFDVSVAGPADWTPVLLLHGFPQTFLCWDGVVAHLTEAGLRTIAPNQRGYSPGARPVGTAAYLSPEQVRGDAVSTATDVYALGTCTFSQENSAVRQGDSSRGG